MNIVFLHRIWPSYGGGETVTKCLANELVKRGHHVHVLYTKKSSQDDPNLDSNIVQTYIPNVNYDEKSSEFFVNKDMAHHVNTFVDDYIVEHQIQIIINQWWPVEFLMNLKYRHNVKIIKCLHMDPDTRKVLDFSGVKGMILKLMLPLYRIVERRKHIYSLDKYVANSDLLVFLAPSFLKFYRDIRKNNAIIEKKTDFVYNPLVYDVKIEDENFLEKKDKTVLFVGRLLEKHKQVSRILKIWQKIEKDGKSSDWNLQIVGDGVDRGLYENMICSMGLKHVTMEGFKNPLPYYQKASIFLMTSAYEGFPMSLIESQQNGVVPIAMDSYSSLHDIIDNGDNGIIVADNDIDGFTKELKRLMQDRELRKDMAKHGLCSCDRYKIDIIVNKWESIFKKLISHKQF